MSGDGYLHGSLASHYAAGEERPLTAYALLGGAYIAAVGVSLAALHVREKQLPTDYAATDLILVGVASHKLSRLITKDKVTSFIRAPFTRFQRSSGHGEVEEEPCGHGLRLALGELLVCPYCLSQWVATGFTLGLIAAPRFTRLVGSVLVAHTISDFLQVAYRAAEGQP